MTIHYHGTPITPREVLYELAGRSFCVPFPDKRDVRVCHEIGESVMLDNGAFSYWRRNSTPSWGAYMVWAEEWLDYATTWAVIPDVIDGDEEDNDRLLIAWFQCGLRKGAPVWHMHESLERLKRLCHGYERVCIGSSGAYKTVGTPAWCRRMEQALNAVYVTGRSDVWLHMLRGMALGGSDYPFASLDSTNIAQNHHLERNDAASMAQRIDAAQCPARWEYREQIEQLEMEGSAA